MNEKLLIRILGELMMMRIDIIRLNDDIIGVNKNLTHILRSKCSMPKEDYLQFLEIYNNLIKINEKYTKNIQENLEKLVKE